MTTAPRKEGKGRKGGLALGARRAPLGKIVNIADCLDKRCVFLLSFSILGYDIYLGNLRNI
jgi:hypothetical protein